jgi:uncharacterized membrane protein
MILSTIQLLWITLEPGLTALMLVSLIVPLIAASSVISPLKATALAIVSVETRTCEGPL